MRKVLLIIAASVAMVMASMVAGPVQAEGSSGNDRLRVTVDSAPVDPDGERAGQPTDLVVTFRDTDPAVPGIGLKSGGTIRLQLPAEFVDRGDRPVVPTGSSPTCGPPLVSSCSTAVILQGWPQSPVLPFPDVTWEESTNTIVVTAAADWMPAGENAPGPKQVHLMLFGFDNPERAGVYRIGVEIRPDPSSERTLTGKGRVRITNRTSPRITAVSLAAGTPPPPFPNPLFQELAAGEESLPLLVYLWDRDAGPTVGADFRSGPARVRPITDSDGRRIGLVSVRPPRGATDWSLRSGGATVEGPAFLTGAPVGSTTAVLETDPDTPGRYHINYRLFGGNSFSQVIDVGRKINVAIVGNPYIQDIADLTPELFTADTGITVDYTFLEDETLREIVTGDGGGGGKQFDAVMTGMFDATQFGANGWLTDLNSYAEADPEYNVDDLIPAVRKGLSVDGSLYAAPFYAESSFVMYRQDVLDEAGLEMPAAPTWDEIAEIARAVDSDETAGICLRGKPGWGDMGASFTTVLNTFGGTWWLANDDGSIGAAQVDQPEFAEALNFYVDLINDAGQDDAANVSFNECLNLYLDGEVAMWYDATVAGKILEGDDSPVKGLNGYSLAPTKVTDASGWLWAWALAIPRNSPDPDTAWEYVSWATSEGYINAAGEALPGGWAQVPPGTRLSTYDNPNYQAAASAYAEEVLQAMLATPIDNPGTTPRPGLPGVQYVGVPEFQDVGDRCTAQFSAAIAGLIGVEDALAACQSIASEVSS